MFFCLFFWEVPEQFSIVSVVFVFQLVGASGWLQTNEMRVDTMYVWCVQIQIRKKFEMNINFIDTLK